MISIPMKMRTLLIRAWRITLKVIAGFIILSVLSVILFRFVPIPVTPLMIIRCVDQLSDKKEVVLKKHWRPLEKISPWMPKAAIASEDQNFEDHFGFDIEAIRKAERYNEKHKGRKLKGASTITQQTAKNVFLWPSRSWVRKGFEVYFSFLIEIFWSKKRIMEVYLNVIETGNGIYGVEAAAKKYYGKTAAKLTMREAAMIAAILPDPRRRNASRPTPYLERRASRIARHAGMLQSDDF